MELAQVVQLDRRPVRDANAPEPKQMIGALDRSREQRSAGVERDARCPRTWAGLDLLAHPLPAAGSLGKHRDDFSRSHEVDGSLDRLNAVRAALDAEAADRRGPVIGLKSSAFDMKRSLRFGKSGMASGQGSKFDAWFAASTNPPFGGMCSTPVARSR